MRVVQDFLELAFVDDCYFFIGYDYEALVVLSFSLQGPVAAAGQNGLVVNCHELVMH